jgi:tRNA-(ms[2]io[6]A)-hydroxylase
VLSLASRTESGWLERALANLDEILVDHAHCEKKAASSALNLLFRYPERHALLLPLTELAREELAHFAEVLRLMTTRRLPLRHQVPSPYAGQLLQAVRTREPERLLDTLLGNALIEARSCERLRLLAEAVPDRDLATLYRGLLASEARHHAIYVELAEQVAPAADVRARLGELAAHEASVIAAAPALVRLHT